MPQLKNKVISLNNRKTSMRLAVEEWNAFDDICKRERLRRKELLELIEAEKGEHFGLTCYVRLFTVAYLHKLAKISSLKSKPYGDNTDIYQTFNLIS